MDDLAKSDRIVHRGLTTNSRPTGYSVEPHTTLRVSWSTMMYAGSSAAANDVPVTSSPPAVTIFVSMLPMSARR